MIPGSDKNDDAVTLAPVKLLKNLGHRSKKELLTGDATDTDPQLQRHHLHFFLPVLVNAFER